MNRRLIISGAALLATVALLAGCGGKPTAPAGQSAPAAQQAPAAQTAAKETVYPLTLKDFAGREVTIAAEPKRVISVAPSTTEMLFALDKGDVLVGRSEFDEYPPEAAKVDSIGGFAPPNYELILSKQPDLVLVIGGSEEARDKLANEYKLPVFVVDPQNFDQVYQAIRTLGQVVNAQEKAEQVAGEMEAKVKEIAAKAAAATSKPKVFYEVWNDPLMTAGTNTFIDEMIRLSGGENVGAAVQGWSNFSLEQVVAANPDLLIVGSLDEVAGVAQRPGWGGIKAVKDGQVHGVVDPDLVTIPGPRLVQGLDWMARLIHPELFK